MVPRWHVEGYWSVVIWQSGVRSARGRKKHGGLHRSDMSKLEMLVSAKVITGKMG